MDWGEGIVVPQWAEVRRGYRPTGGGIIQGAEWRHWSVADQ